MHLKKIFALILAITVLSVSSACIYAETVPVKKLFDLVEYSYSRLYSDTQTFASGIGYKATGMNRDGSYNVMLTSYPTTESIVEIPESFSSGGKKYYITSLGDDLFNNNKKIVSVSFPVAVKSLGARTFYGCTNLSSVTGFNSVETIGKSCFENCTALNNVNLYGTYLSDLPENCFAGCTSLKKISIRSYSPINIANGTFKNCTDLSELTFYYSAENILSIGDYAFYNCGSLTEFTVPESVDHIGKAAFSRCVMLEDIVIPSTVTEISESAFSGCLSLSRLTLPEKTTKISSSAFEECGKLKAISIPESVAEIESNAFNGCTELHHIHISSSKSIVDYIGKGSLPNNVNFYYPVDQNGECSMGARCPMISDSSEPSEIPDTSMDKTVIKGMPAVIEADPSGSSYVWQINYDNKWDTLDCREHIITINDISQDCVVKCLICDDTGSVIKSLTVNITAVSVNDVTTDMVESMSIEDCIDFVKLFSDIGDGNGDNECNILTDAMELAVTRVLENDRSE